MGASGASDSWLEIIRKRAKQAINGQFGTIWGLIVSIFALNRADNEKTLNPRSRLRRRRIAEFELVKPRIHPAEFYGGNEDETPQTVQYKELSESGNHDREFGPV